MKGKKQIALDKIVKELDSFFEVKSLETDPAMSHFMPQVYKGNEADLKQFEKDFLRHYNGLMIKGDINFKTIFTASFPHDEILNKFITESDKGDLLFLHHPIPLESGDPKGKLGRGFLQNNLNLIQKIVNKKLSVYVCHAPLDYNERISTGRAISEALGGKVEKTFLPYGNGEAGLIVEIDPISAKDLIRKLRTIFKVPYLDTAGKTPSVITKVGIVAGGGDEVEYSQTVKKMGAQVYITGEVFSHQESDWARKNSKKIREYVKTAEIFLIGVSHAASESLVMRTQLPKWFKSKFGIPVVPLSQKKWWL